MPKKKEKPLVIKGHSIHSLTAGTLFENHICTVFEEMYNEIEVAFCSEKRYEDCCKKKECAACKPNCNIEMCQFLKLTYSKLAQLPHRVLREEVHAKLNRTWKRCKPVEITVRRTEDDR